LQTILRGQLGFEDVILADDLGMGAIVRHYENSQSVLRSLEAGTDIVMLCHDWAAVRPSLEAAQSISGRTAWAKTDLHLSQSHSRIERLWQRMATMEKTAPPSGDVIGCAEHRELAAEIRARVRKMKT
jgi:beta-N-acetylhexosaminidase